MTSRHLNDADVEAVLAGQTPVNDDLAVLSDVVDGIRQAYTAELDDAHVVGLSGRLAAVAAAAPLDGGPVGASRPRSRMRRRGAIAAGAAGLAVLAFGSAAAADEAAPGDFLYGLDRALEAVGINNGGAQERLAEVQALLAAGDVDEALELAVEAVDDMDDMDEAEAEELTGLLHAAESVLSEGSDQSLERREQVAAMLTFMAETELTGKDFGQAVSQQARGIVADETTDAADKDSDDADTAVAEDGADDATDEAPGNSGSANSNSNSNSNSGSSNSDSGSSNSSSNSNSNAGGSSDKGDSSSDTSDSDSDSSPNENANPNATSNTRGNSGKDK